MDGTHEEESMAATQAEIHLSREIMRVGFTHRQYYSRSFLRPSCARSTMQ